MTDDRTTTDTERTDRSIPDETNDGVSGSGRVASDGGRPASDEVASVGSDTLAVNSQGLLSGVPGNAAGFGVGLMALTIGVLLLPVGVELPGFAFIVMEEATLFVLYAMVLLGLNLQFGDTGLINFGPVLFLGLGLYGMSLVSANVPSFAAGLGLGLFWGFGLLAGILAAVVGGFVLGASSLRLRGDYLAITTLAAAEILNEFVNTFRFPFGGSRGLVGVPQLVSGPGGTGVLPLAETGGLEDLSTLLLFSGVLFVSYEGFRRLSKSPYGRVLRSIQADEDATRGMGKPTLSYKVQVFIYGAAVAGLAGGLMGMFFGAADPALISIDVTVIIWIGMMIGGAGNSRGALVGLAIIMFFELVIRLLNGPVTSTGVVSATQFNALRGALVGLLLILVIRYRPEGLFGDPEKLEVFK